MSRKSLKGLIVIVVSAAVGFGLFFGVNLILVNRTVTKPLENSLRQVPGVLSVKAHEGSGRLKIDVSLGQVQDFHETYSSLVRRVSEIVGKREYELDILDHRDDQLEMAYYQMHYDIQEAIATGGFSRMASALEQHSRDLGLSGAKVFVDQRAVYLQLQSGSNYLYAVFPRTPGGVPSEGLVFGGTAGP
ncbi:MAG: hypothetical protein Q8P50_05245 [Bacillota bacterium]|nr:hypothetical protein [Bacillota bacterium]